MSLTAIINEALPASRLAFFIRGYNFCHPRNRGGVRGNRICEVDQQITFVRQNLLATDGYGSLRFSRFGPDSFVRYETAIAESPQEIIEPLHAFVVCNMNMHGMLQPIGLLGQPACELLPGQFSATGEDIEIDFGHDQGMTRARRKTNSDSIGTGLPVLPLAFPERHAVPAISR